MPFFLLKYLFLATLILLVYTNKGCFHIRHAIVLYSHDGSFSYWSPVTLVMPFCARAHLHMCAVGHGRWWYAASWSELPARRLLFTAVWSVSALSLGVFFLESPTTIIFPIFLLQHRPCSTEDEMGIWQPASLFGHCWFRTSCAPPFRACLGMVLEHRSLGSNVLRSRLKPPVWKHPFTQTYIIAKQQMSKCQFMPHIIN